MGPLVQRTDRHGRQNPGDRRSMSGYANRKTLSSGSSRMRVCDQNSYAPAPRTSASTVAGSIWNRLNQSSRRNFRAVARRAAIFARRRTASAAGAPTARPSLIGGWSAPEICRAFPASVAGGSLSTMSGLPKPTSGSTVSRRRCSTGCCPTNRTTGVGSGSSAVHEPHRSDTRRQLERSSSIPDWRTTRHRQGLCASRTLVPNPGKPLVHAVFIADADW